MVLQFGSIKLGKTKALSKTGATGSWNEDDLMPAHGWNNHFIIEDKQQEVPLIARVYDGLNLLGDKIIGETSLSIDSAFSGTLTQLKGEIFRRKKEKTGEITVTVIMEGPLVVPPLEAKPSDDDKAGAAEVDAAIAAQKEEEAMNDKGQKEKELEPADQTPTAEDETAPLAEPEISSQKKDDMEGALSAPTAATAPDTEINGPEPPKYSPRGRSPRPSTKETSTPSQPSNDMENGGTIVVKEIEVKNLPKSVSGMFDTNDPYVTLRFGDNDCVNQTKTRDNAGEQARWDKLYFEIEVTKKGLQEKTLNLKVYDENSLVHDTFIGEAFMKLGHLLDDVGKEIETEFIDIYPTYKKGDAKEKSCGQIKLSLLLKPNPSKVEKEPPLNLKDLEAIPLDNGAVIHIDKIVCKNLTNVDFFGKNDPLVEFRFGKQEKKIATSTRTDAGSECNWDESDEMDLRIVAAKNDIIREHDGLYVEVYDYNYTGNKLIGKARVDVKKLMLTIDEKVELPRFNIYRNDADREKGIKSGVVELTLRLTKKPENMIETEDGEEIVEVQRVKPELIEDVKLKNGAILKIDKIVAKDLINVELMPGDKNDPFVILKLGEKGNEYKTKAKDNAGSYADWENVNLEIETYKDQLTTEKLSVTVYDENVTMKKLIGATDLIVDELLLKIGQQQELPMAIIRDKKGKKTGFVKVFATLHEKPGEVPEEPPDPKLLEAIDMPNGALITFTKISCKDLKNVEIFGKNDPYCEIQLGPEGEKVVTDSKDNAGASCTWEEKDLEIHDIKIGAGKDNVVKDLLYVTVYDKNSLNADKKIGEGSISLAKVLLDLNKDIELRRFKIYQTEKDKDNNLHSGFVTLNVKVSHKPTIEEVEEKKEEWSKEITEIRKPPTIDPKEVENIDLPYGGIVTISKVVCEELQNVEGLMGGKNDPFVTFQFGNDEDSARRTSPQEESGADASWENLDFEIDVTKQDVINNELIVTVFDENKLFAHKEIGKVKMSLMILMKGLDTPPATNAEVVKRKPFEFPPIDILNDKNEVSGRVYLYMSLDHKPKEVFTAPPERKDLEAVDLKFGGLVTFEKIICKGLKNVELWGKNDPYCTFTFGKDGSNTKLVHENGKQTKQLITTCKINSGTDAAWDIEKDNDKLDFQIITSKEEIINDVLYINVKDGDNTVVDKLIGKAEVSLSRLLLNMDKTYELPAISLYNSENDRKKNKKSGTMKLFLKLTEREEDVHVEQLDEDAYKDINVMDTVVTIRGIELKDLEAHVSGFGDTNDPYVVMQFGSSDLVQTTKQIDNAGQFADWNDLEFDIAATKTQLIQKTLKVQVYDKNYMPGFSDTFIGEGLISLAQLLKRIDIDKSEEFEWVDLVNPKKKNKVTGSIKLFATCREKLQEPDKPPVDYEALMAISFDYGGVICINKIVCKNLTNVEMIGKNDPFVQLQLGEDGSMAKTTTQQDTGSEAYWEDLDIELDCTKKELMGEELHIKVFDENSHFANTLIGTASVSMQNLLLTIDDVDPVVELDPITIKNKNKDSGEVRIFASLQRKPPPEKKPSPEALAKVQLEHGLLTIRKIACHGLVNVELLGGGLIGLSPGKNDPFVTVQLGENGLVAKTSTKDNAGSEATWDDLDLTIEAPKESFVDDKLKIEVYDENTIRAHAFIGSAYISIASLLLQLSEEKEFSKVRLVDKKGNKAGTITLFMTLEEKPSQGTAPVDPEELKKIDLKNGCLEISKIVCKGLKNVEMGIMGKNDPFVEFHFANKLPAKTRTETKNNAGSEASWLNQKFQIVASKQEFINEKLRVEVFDENAVMAHAFIGAVDLPCHYYMINMNILVPVVGNILDRKGNVTGRVKIFGKMIEAGQTEAERKAAELEAKKAKKAAADEAKAARENEARLAALHSDEALPGFDKNAIDDLRSSLVSEIRNEGVMIVHEMETRLKHVTLGLNKTIQTKGLAPAGKAVDIALPENKYEWRANHVQGWLVFTEGLEQYVQNFRDGSVDGLVLLKHVNDDILKMNLGVENTLHRLKLIEGIKKLKEEQAMYEKKMALLAEEKAKKAAQRAKEQPKLPEATKKTDKPKDKKKKKKKKHKKNDLHLENIVTGKAAEVVGENELKRISFVKKVKSLQNKSQEEKKEDAWAFDYTLNHHAHTSKGYADMMGGLLDTEELKLSGVLLSKPIENKMNILPNSRTTDEVITILKSSMLKVVRRLVEFKRLSDAKPTEDYDLDQLEEDALHVINTLPPPDVVEDVSAKENLESDNLGDERAPSMDNEVDLGSDDETSVLPDAPPPGYEEAQDHPLPTSRNETSSVAAADSIGTMDASELMSARPEGPPPEYDNGIEDEEEMSVIPAAPPPAYDESMKHPSPTAHREKQEEEEELMKSAPPSLEPSAFRRNNLSRLPSPSKKKSQIVYDNCEVMFDAFLELENEATWLNPVKKLTRLKFKGGCEDILKIKMTWGQFTGLWTKLDSGSRGEINLEEFKDVFGSISEMDFNHEIDTTAPIAATSEQKELLKYMYEMSDVLRHAGFTVKEMFAGFDRNGSGGVSVSEFCSMLRICLGRAVDKKIVYRVMSSLDTDGDKNITLEEVQLFIFYIWRAQLKEIASRVYLDTTLDDKTLRSMVKEKDDIKNAIIRNFPRRWRDEAVKVKIDSPFTNLFNQDAGSVTGGTVDVWTKSDTQMKGSFATSSGTSSPNHLRKSGSFEKGTIVTGTNSRSNSPSKHHHKPQANNSSSLKILAMKKKNESVPYREGKRLGNVPAHYVDDQAHFLSMDKLNYVLSMDKW